MTGTSTARRPGRAGSTSPGRRAAALPVAERRAAVIAAAAPLLQQRGHDVTTRQIAEAAGIAEGTVFRVFPTKQALVDAVVAEACNVSATVDRIRAVDPAAPLDERVRRCATILQHRLSTMIDLMIALRMHRPPHPAPAPGDADRSGPGAARQRGRRHAEGQNEVLDAVAEVLAPDADRLRCPPARAAHLLRLLAFAGTHRMINDDDPLSADEIADVLLHGIAGPARRDRTTAGAHPTPDEIATEDP